MSQFANPSPRSSIWNDVRFRGACVFVALILLIVWLVWAAMRRKEPVKLAKIEFKSFRALKPGEWYEAHFKDRVVRVRDIAGVMTFSRAPEGTHFFLDAQQAETPLPSFDDYASGGTVVPFPRGNRSRLMDGRCVAIDSGPIRSFSLLGGKIVGQWAVPGLYSSPPMGLKPSPSPDISASVVYLNRGDLQPLSLLKISRKREVGSTWTTSMEALEITYAPVVSLGYGPLLSGSDTYFYLPFAKDQNSVRVSVFEEKTDTFHQDFDLPHTEIVRTGKWPTVRLTQNVELACSNGMKLELPPQNLCWGLVPKIEQRTFGPTLHLKGQRVDASRPGAEFRVLGLTVDGKKVTGLGNDTPVGPASECRLSVTLYIKLHRQQMADIPVEVPAKRVFVTEQDMVAQASGRR